MRQAIRIEGVDDCLRLLDNVPANALKICRKTFRTAAKETSRHIRKSIPKRFRRLTRYKVGKTAMGNIYARIGLYNKKESSGHQPQGGDPVFDWFKAYWANYGTLSRRDPTHHFQYKVKPKSKNRRQSVGQPPQRFFEKAINGWEDVFVDTFQKEVKKNESDLYKR